MGLTLAVRVLTPFAWAILPLTKIPFPFYFLFILGCLLASAIIQPLVTLAGTAIFMGFIVASYVTSKPNKPRVLAVNESGKEDGEILFFIQGWPDQASLWDKALPAFEKTYRCVTFTMPNHMEILDSSDFNPWGFSFDETVDTIALTLNSVLEKYDRKQVILVAHDWGSVWMSMLVRRYPQLAKAIVQLDVSVPPHKPMSVKAMISAGMAYQYYNMFTFFLAMIPIFGMPIATWMDWGLKKQFLKLWKKYDVFPGPLSNYPYFHFHLQHAKTLFGLSPPFDVRHKIKWEGPYPKCPLIFIYGADKKFAFHSPKYIKMLEERKDGSKVVGLGKENKKTKVGHWLMVTATEEFTKCTTEWLDEVKL